MNHFTRFVFPSPALHTIEEKLQKYFYAGEHELVCIYGTKMCYAIIREITGERLAMFSDLYAKAEHLRMSDEGKKLFIAMATIEQRQKQGETMTYADSKDVYELTLQICTRIFPQEEASQPLPTLVALGIGILIGASTLLQAQLAYKKQVAVNKMMAQ